MVSPKSPLGDAAFRRKDLMGSSAEASYAGALSFMRRKYTRNLKGVDVAITGIPFDQAVTNRPGTRFGPQAIRQASAQHAWGPLWPWRFDPFDTLAAIDYGDCFFDWGRKQDVPRLIEKHIAGIVSKGVCPLTFGGDHYITYPVLKAVARVHGPLGLVQFDAHRDVEANGSSGRIDHGSMFSLALEDGLVDPARSIQVGIRTCFRGEDSMGMKVMYADEVHAMSAEAVADAIRTRLDGGPSYMTLDIDFLDPATAPGTGTPVPGGFTSYQALAILRAMKGMDFVGMDVVEVSPAYDHAEMTSNAAATIAAEMLCLKAYAAGARPEEMTG